MYPKIFQKIYNGIEHYLPTSEEKTPCTHCGGVMRHLLHQDNSMSAEAKFGCLQCKKTEFRGGWGSEIWLERIYVARRKNFYLKRLYSAR